MAELSPALTHDLEYALARYGLTVGDVPRDHEGLHITDRVNLLLQEGQSYPGSEFRRHDLRNERVTLWKLFPENPVAVSAQCDILDRLHEALREEAEFHADGESIVRRTELPTRAHREYVDELMSCVDGDAEPPVLVQAMWSNASLFEAVVQAIPPLREARACAALRSALVAELAAGAVSPAAAEVTRMAMDSDALGLRNADIVLATREVTMANLRDSLALVVDRVRRHVELADEIRQCRDDLDRLDETLHWPGGWQSAPWCVSCHTPAQ